MRARRCVGRYFLFRTSGSSPAAFAFPQVCRQLQHDTRGGLSITGSLIGPMSDPCLVRDIGPCAIWGGRNSYGMSAGSRTRPESGILRILRILRQRTTDPLSLLARQAGREISHDSLTDFPSRTVPIRQSRPLQRRSPRRLPLTWCLQP